MDPGRREVRCCGRGWLQAEPVWLTGTRYWQRNHQFQHRYTICHPQPRQQYTVHFKFNQMWCVWTDNTPHQTCMPAVCTGWSAKQNFTAVWQLLRTHTNWILMEGTASSETTLVCHGMKLLPLKHKLSLVFQHKSCSKLHCLPSFQLTDPGTCLCVFMK